MAFYLSCVYLLSALVYIAYGGPGHSHQHHKHSDKGEWLVRMQMVNATTKQPADKSWVITRQDMQSYNVRQIIRAIEWYEHNLYNASKDHLTTTDDGYQGFEFNHMIKGKIEHTWTLPKCKLPNLEKALISVTSGNSMTAKTKKDINTKTLDNCRGKKKKTARTDRTKKTA